MTKTDNIRKTKLRQAIQNNNKIKTINKTNKRGKSKRPSPNKVKNRENRRNLHKKRRELGLLSHNGFVKFNTVVHLDVVDKSFQEKILDGFLEGIPLRVIRDFDKEDPLKSKLKALRELEEEIKRIVTPKDLEKHKFGANEGVNLGISVVDGGPHSCKAEGISGSVHCAGFVKDRPQLRARVEACIKSILDEAFGNLLWYKRALHVTERLNKDSGERRTIPGIPCSGIWLNLRTREDAVHCDENITGGIFVLSTYPSDGGSAALCVLSDNEEPGKTDLQPGQVMGGSWGSTAHCNLRVGKTVASQRMSWTVYLDYRVFGRNYKFVFPKGYVKH